MKPLRWMLVSAVFCCCGYVHADVIKTLTDEQILKRAQADISLLSLPDLDALNQTVSTCAAVSIGQRPQQFECERSVNLYWTHFSRGRALDGYIAAFGSLLAGFDNNALNPSGDMISAYKKSSADLVTLAHAINARYRQLDK